MVEDRIDRTRGTRGTRWKRRIRRAGPSSTARPVRRAVIERAMVARPVVPRTPVDRARARDAARRPAATRRLAPARPAARPRGLRRRQPARLARRARRARRARVPADDRDLERVDRRRARARCSPARSRPGCSASGVWLRERKGQTEAALAAAAVGIAGLFGTLVVAGPVYQLVPAPLAFAAAFATGAFATWLGIALARAGDGLARPARRAVGADRARRVRRRRHGLPGDRVRRDDPRARPPALDRARRLRLRLDDGAVGHVGAVRLILVGRADRLRRADRRLRLRPRAQPPRPDAGRDWPGGARRRPPDRRQPARPQRPDPGRDRLERPRRRAVAGRARGRAHRSRPCRYPRHADLARARARRGLDRHRARRHRVRRDRERAPVGAGLGRVRAPVRGHPRRPLGQAERDDQARRRGHRPPGRRGRPPRRPDPRHGRPARPDRAGGLPEPRRQRTGRGALRPVRRHHGARRRRRARDRRLGLRRGWSTTGCARGWTRWRWPASRTSPASRSRAPRSPRCSPPRRSRWRASPAAPTTATPRGRPPASPRSA